MNLTAHTAIRIDAAATASTAVLMLAARSMLYPYFGLTSPMWLDAVAAAFLVYAAVIALAATASIVSRATLMTIAAANIAYVVASMVVLVLFWGDMHAVGRGLIVAVALAVEAFAMLQLLAARRQHAVEPA